MQDAPRQATCKERPKSISQKSQFVNTSVDKVLYLYMQPLSPQQSILATLAFFDAFDQPLTIEEITAYQWQGNASVEEITHTVEALIQSGMLIRDRGYIGLRALGRERVIRTMHVEHKLAIARRAAKLLRYVPFVRAVFVCNNLALETVSQESDIDVFIIVQQGRIWTARVVATAILRCIGIARTRKKTIDRVCLSFYITDDALDISNITITDPDVYMMYWIRSLLPLYDPDNLYEVMQRKNSWVDTYIRPIYDVQVSNAWRVDSSRISRGIQTILETMWKGRYGDLIEQQAKKLQLAKMKLRDSVRDEPDSRVIVSDQMLKFHENDRRVYYKEAWEARVVDYITHST
jgi:hypothetical protein